MQNFEGEKGNNRDSNDDKSSTWWMWDSFVSYFGTTKGNTEDNDRKTEGNTEDNESTIIVDIKGEEIKFSEDTDKYNPGTQTVQDEEGNILERIDIPERGPSGIMPLVIEGSALTALAAAHLRIERPLGFDLLNIFQDIQQQQMPIHLKYFIYGLFLKEVLYSYGEEEGKRLLENRNTKPKIEEIDDNDNSLEKISGDSSGYAMSGDVSPE